MYRVKSRFWGTSEDIFLIILIFLQKKYLEGIEKSYIFALSKNTHSTE